MPDCGSSDVDGGKRDLEADLYLYGAEAFLLCVQISGGMGDCTGCRIGGDLPGYTGDDVSKEKSV